MNPSERTLQVLGLAVPTERRARFLEEWLADLRAGRAHGLSPREVLAAATQVAVFLVLLRVRAGLRGCSRRTLLVLGCGLGAVVVVTDVPVAVLVPIVVLALAGALVRLVVRWVTCAP